MPFMQLLDEKREIAWKDYDLKKRDITVHKNQLIERLTNLADATIDDNEGFLIEWFIK